MTDEQQERLQEIRERVAERALYADPPLWDDIVFLLGLRIDSLLTPDEAELIIGAIPLQSGLIDSQVEGDSDDERLEAMLKKSGIQHTCHRPHDAGTTLERLARNISELTATSMRSACIEKVKAKEVALRKIAEGAEKAGNMIWSKSALAQAECAQQIWKALESVTIQEQEKQSRENKM